MLARQHQPSFKPSNAINSCLGKCYQALPVCRQESIMVMIMLLMHAGDRIGVLPTEDFARSSTKSRFVTGNGSWLAAPSAVLMGTDGNTTHAVLLSLGNPTYDSLSKVCWNGCSMCRAGHGCAPPPRQCIA